MEGSFGSDILVGDSRPNAMLGQPGRDTFFGNGGDDVIDARDGVRDRSIQCARGHEATKKRKATGTPAGRALTDTFDPPPFNCAITKHGTPVPGLNG
jgi:Ca2+-binding RTX toxin-like protein